VEVVHKADIKIKTSLFIGFEDISLRKLMELVLFFKIERIGF